MLLIRETSPAQLIHRKVNGNAIAVEAVSSGQRQGLCVFTLRDHAVYIEDAYYQDLGILDGLVRAGFSAAWQRGYGQFGFSPAMAAALRERLLEIGIPKEGRLEAFFSRTCRG